MEISPSTVTYLKYIHIILILITDLIFYYIMMLCTKNLHYKCTYKYIRMNFVGW